MKRSEEKKQRQTEETNEPSRFENVVYYFDIFYRVVKALIIMLVVILLVGGSLVAGAAVGYFVSLVSGTDIPDHEVMVQQIYDFNETSTMYYAGGEVISDLRADLMRTPVELEQMSPLLVDAIIATEDEYFFDHEGIVPKAIARALVQDLTESGASTGGSTITQQLIKQQIIGGEVSHERKANEILLAMRIENYMDKEEILEAYLNVSPFGRNNKGQNIAGVEEAAQGIFGVPASEVTLPQAAFLAGLPQRPNVFSPYTNTGAIKEDQELGLRRQREVLFRMYRVGLITYDEYQEALEYDLTQDFLNREEIDYEDLSYVYDRAEFEARRILVVQALERDGITNEELEENPDLLSEYEEQIRSEIRNGGYQIFTTIDRDVHHAMEETVREYQDQLGAEQTYTWEDADGNTQSTTLPVQYGGSLIDNDTGRIIGFIGGRDYELSQFNNAFQMNRSPGSVIKPLAVYGPAIDANLLNPATIIPDTEVEIRDDWNPATGEWNYYTPTNVGATTNEWLTARESLEDSKNLAAFKIHAELMQEDVDLESYIRNMGITADDVPSEKISFPSFSIGGPDGPSPVGLISAFSTIGNNGQHADAYMIERIENSAGEIIYEHEVEQTEVWSPASNYLLIDMLRGVHTDGTAQGTIDQLNFSSDWVSKTGTTQDRHDVWYIGSTPSVSFGTWMGYGTSELSLRDDFGLHPSRRNRDMWARIMNAVHAVNPDILGVGETHARPDGVTEDSVIVDTGMKAGEVEAPDGSTFNYSGNTHTELFKSDNVPGTTVYDFAIGATDEELEEFWGRALSSDDDDDDDDDEDDEETEDDAASDDESNGDESSEAPEPEPESEPEPEDDEDDEEESSNGNGNGNGNDNASSNGNNGSSNGNESSDDNDDSNDNGSSNGNGNGNGSSNGNGNVNSEATPPSDKNDDDDDNTDDEEE